MGSQWLQAAVEVVDDVTEPLVHALVYTVGGRPSRCLGD